MEINGLLLINTQGKLRLERWYNGKTDTEKRKIIKDITNGLLSWDDTKCTIFDYGVEKIIFKRYASLFFVIIAPSEEVNELYLIEVIHRIVETLDGCFANVCELDLVYGFERAYHAIDSMIHGGILMETSIDTVCKELEYFSELENKKETRPIKK
eukprot:GHVP01005701.1.p1 GENE.GHVP01005701.1~~GHVP01005701.1.p1  ORF type:complete len:155 (+),score=23.92 GHVP01005701.1:293-757(+)